MPSSTNWGDVRERRQLPPATTRELVILSFCLFVIAAVLVLPQVDLLDAAGAEVTSAVSVRCHFGGPPSLRLSHPMPVSEGVYMAHAEGIQPMSSAGAGNLHSSQDFLCLLRC